jgi:predicted RNA-binding Zn-ribbon protein involved in translation (DUF1610 family)
MSQTGRKKGHGASFGPGQALLNVDLNEYETTEAAVRAALDRCPRFTCPDCGLKIFSRPTRCRNCGTEGSEFNRHVPAEEGT